MGKTVSLTSTVGMLKETVEKQPQLVKSLRSAYMDAVQIIKAGHDEDFFNLSTPKEVSAAMKQNKPTLRISGEMPFFSRRARFSVRNIFGLAAEYQVT